MMEIKIIDRYVLKKFLSILLMAIIVFLVIFHVVDIIEKIDRFLKNKMTFIQILTFYYYQLPFYISIAIPMSMLLASVFTIGTLAKHNELTALKASGISLHRFSLPILIVGFFISVTSFFFEDFIVIPASRVRIEIEKNQMKRHRKYRKKIFNNITFQESKNRNIVIERFYLKDVTAKNITIQESKNNILTKRIDAKNMIWIPENKKWQIRNFKIREFSSDNKEIVSEIFTDSLFTLDITPNDISMLNRKPEEMRYNELMAFIKRLQISGNNTRRWEVNLHYKIAFPFTNFIVILFGLPLTVMKNRKSTSVGAGLSLLIIFIYYAFIKFGQVLGFEGDLSPILGAWLGNIIFFFCGTYMFYKISQ